MLFVPWFTGECKGNELSLNGNYDPADVRGKLIASCAGLRNHNNTVCLLWDCSSICHWSASKLLMYLKGYITNVKFFFFLILLNYCFCKTYISQRKPKTRFIRRNTMHYWSEILWDSLYCMQWKSGLVVTWVNCLKDYTSILDTWIIIHKSTIATFTCN